MKPPELPPTRKLAQMLLGNQIQQAIYVSAKLGIADLLADSAKGGDELASVTGAHADALRRLLRALASVGVFAEDDRGRFELTPLGSLLRSDTRESMRSFALWSGGVSYRAFGSLDTTVMTGKPAFETVFGEEFFDYLGRHPEVGAVFDDMMSRHTAPIAPVVASYDFADAKTVVDVGGGPGDLLVAILTAHPKTQGILVDHPRVAERAREAFTAAGVADRCRIVSADVSEGVPAGGDVYVLKSVVHGLEDDAAARLLGDCRKAMRDRGKVLLVELVMPEGNGASPVKLMDLLMLMGCQGRERTEPEFRSLLERAGLRLAAVTPTKHAYSLIEARAA